MRLGLLIVMKPTPLIAVSVSEIELLKRLTVSVIQAQVGGLLRVGQGLTSTATHPSTVPGTLSIRSLIT